MKRNRRHLPHIRIGTRLFVPGVSVSEYALPVALIAIVAIGGLSLLSDNLKDALCSFSADLKQTPDFGSPLQSQELAAITASTTGPAAGQLPTDDSLKNATQKQAQSQELLDFTTAVDVSQNIETSGATGATFLLAQQIERLAQQSLAAGEINQEQANRLMGLAQEGYKVSNIEQLYENAFIQGEKVSYNGKQYSPETFADLFGMAPIQVTKQSRQDYVNLETYAVSDSLKPFAKAYQAAKTDVLNVNPALQADIALLTGQIAAVAQTLSKSVWDLETGSASVSDSKAALTQSLQSNYGDYQESYGLNKLSDKAIASGITHNNARDICDKGKAGDTCE